MIKSSYLVNGQRKFILVVKSQSKYLAGQHFDRGRRSEYRIYRSVTPLNFKGALRSFLVHFGAVVEHSVCYANNYFNIQIDLKIILILLSMFIMYTNKPSYIPS